MWAITQVVMGTGPRHNILRCSEELLPLRGLLHWQNGLSRTYLSDTVKIKACLACSRRLLMLMFATYVTWLAEKLSSPTSGRTPGKRPFILQSSAVSSSSSCKTLLYVTPENFPSVL